VRNEGSLLPGVTVANLDCGPDRLFADISAGFISSMHNGEKVANAYVVADAGKDLEAHTQVDLLVHSSPTAAEGYHCLP
jgi:hypothetical protein